MAEDRMRIIMTSALRDESGAPIKGLRPANHIPLTKLPPGLKQGEKGEAEIGFSVLEDGSVADVLIVAATHEEFGAAFRNNVAEWKFGPPRETGLVPPVRARNRFTFKVG